MVMVTSWDDWNEDTGIEPIGGTPTDIDDSPSGTAYTQGYTYGGEGRTALRVLRTDANLLDQHVRGRAGWPHDARPRCQPGELVLMRSGDADNMVGTPSRSWGRRVGVHAHQGPEGPSRLRAPAGAPKEHQ